MRPELAARCLLLLAIWLVSGCAASNRPARDASAGSADVTVPAFADEYSTDPGANGVRGGSAALDAERRLTAKLKARGDEIEPDQALAATAAWALRRAYAGQDLSDLGLFTDAARRFGFAGMVQGMAVMSLEEEDKRQLIDSMLTSVPKNLPISRYGIVAGRGTDVAIVVGVVEMSLEDFPRSAAPGGELRLRGKISDRFQRASVFSTSPDGKISEIPMKGREIEANVTFPQKGIYSLEIMGYGKPGPVVLLNVPVLVGVQEVDSASDDDEPDPNLTTAQAEAALLELLNEERKRAGAPPVKADPELYEIALAHSTDMLESGFVGHVSPSTGQPDQRVRKAQIRVSRAGECVALAPTPRAAHRGLLASPAHRVLMLDPTFTHVGIGTTLSQDNTGQARLHVTMLLGRRVPISELAQTPESLFAAIQKQRKARKLPAVRTDKDLAQIANAGTRALANGSAKTPDQALALSGAELQRVVNRTKKSRQVCQAFNEILEREQLATLDLLQQPEVASIGIGLVELPGAKGPRLGVMIAAEAASGKALRCE